MPLPPNCSTRLSSKLISQLDSRIQKFLQYQDDIYKPAGYIFLLPGQYVHVNNLDFQIVAFLGKGSEGFLYLVETDQGLAVAKVFFPNKYEQGVKDIRSLQNLLPRIYYEDPKTHTILQGYQEGLPVSYIGWHLKDLLSPNEATQLIRKWQVWSTQETFKQLGLVILESNAIYSFKTQKFQLIDPH